MKVAAGGVVLFGALAFVAVLSLTQPRSSAVPAEATTGVAAGSPVVAPARLVPIATDGGALAPAAPAAAAAHTPMPISPTAPPLVLAGRSTAEMREALKDRQRAAAEAAGELSEYEAREAQRESRREARREEREARRAAAEERRQLLAAEFRARRAAFEAGAEPPRPRQPAPDTRRTDSR